MALKSKEHSWKSFVINNEIKINIKQKRSLGLIGKN